MDLETLRQVAEEFIPFNKFLGIEVASIEPGKVRLEIPFRDVLIGDPMKPAMHGGVLSALADTTGGLALWSAIDDPRRLVSTIDLRIDYIRPGRLERIAAEGTIVRIGGRVGVADIRLFHPAKPEETVATGKGVYAINAVRAAKT